MSAVDPNERGSRIICSGGLAPSIDLRARSSSPTKAPTAAAAQMLAVTASTTGHRRGVVNAVNFGGKVLEPPPLDETGKPSGGPANRRAEMWSNLKSALQGGRFCLPDRDSLQADLVSCGYKYTSDGKLLLESKEEMRKRGTVSPDEGDAVALCFSEPDGSAFPRGANFNRDLRDQYGGCYV